MVILNKGTVETIQADLVDTLANVTTLNSLGLKYDLYKDDPAETMILTNVATTNVGMKALPLIDTTNLAEGVYVLYIKFDSTPEHPRLGPIKFRVD